MYLKEIIIENTGPIEKINKVFTFNEIGNPKPLILIGQNGAGKSIFLSHIVNALITAKQVIYNDCDVENGKVFKYRSPSYINVNNTYSYSKVTFEEAIFLKEWQLNMSKKDYEKHYKHTPLNDDWKDINENETSSFIANFQDKNEEIKRLVDNNCILYFPPNRFEEPGWLNYDNLINKSNYRFQKNLSNISNRQIINHSPLKENQNWLLDLLFDKYTLELKTQNLNLPINISTGQKFEFPLPIFAGYEGESNLIHNEIVKFIKILFQTNDNLRFGVGKRRNRQIEIVRNEKTWVKNIFNLSTGETILLNVFLSIIKDYDLSSAKFISLSEIRGIVIIDEVDIHLHSNLQYDVLPKLIKLFPKVQFILTSHSPLFLLGLKNHLGEEKFEIINLPDGEEIDIESFSEFDNAYKIFSESIKFKAHVKNEVQISHKPLLFLEGDYDIRYLKKASELLEKKDTLDYFKLVDSDGHGNITNVAKHFDTKLAEVTPQKILLLYDCDQKKQPSKKGRIYKRVMPTIHENPIKVGIENLFPHSTIQKAIKNKPALIDITPQIEKIERGQNVLIPELLEVNKNEKKNLCDWIIDNCDVEDFIHFNSVFEILDEIIKD